MKRAGAIGAAQGADRIALAYADRHVRRKKLVSEEGEEILLDLPEPRELKAGEALILDEGGAVDIVAAPEPLAEARAAGPDLARLAWHIGNRHTPCEIQADRLLIQRDHVLEDMLRRLGAEVAHIEAPFQPEGGAYGHGRTHAHAHAHGPHDDPNAHIPHRHDHG